MIDAILLCIFVWLTLMAHSLRYRTTPFVSLKEDGSIWGQQGNDESKATLWPYLLHLPMPPSKVTPNLWLDARKTRQRRGLQDTQRNRESRVQSEDQELERTSSTDVEPTSNKIRLYFYFYHHGPWRFLLRSNSTAECSVAGLRFANHFWRLETLMEQC